MMLLQYMQFLRYYISIFYEKQNHITYTRNNRNAANKSQTESKQTNMQSHIMQFRPYLLLLAFLGSQLVQQ